MYEKMKRIVFIRKGIRAHGAFPAGKRGSFPGRQVAPHSKKARPRKPLCLRQQQLPFIKSHVENPLTWIFPQNSGSVHRLLYWNFAILQPLFKKKIN
jgi:hypothetical protein